MSRYRFHFDIIQQKTDNYMYYIETRGNDAKQKERVLFSDAILNPRASYGGLYAPEHLPVLDSDFVKKHINDDYKELSKVILKKFEIDISDDLLDSALSRYERFDDPDLPVPVVELEKGRLFVSELYHGPTRAFKDMALQPFGRILSSLAAERDKNYLIMAATSGDTGPATLETFKNQKNIKVVCLYPSGGTSDVQRLQMVTEEASNLKVLGVKGNFDDTQKALKDLLSSDDFLAKLSEREISLSAANSVNFGRIIFQIVYHVYSYIELVRRSVISTGDEVDMIVPSGNFGNALGAYYAKKAGIPIGKIVIASNINNILSEWINEGRYDLRERSLIKTDSPAMDILVSSNVERVLFDKFGAERTRELMERLKNDGFYTLEADEIASIKDDFMAVYSTDKEGREAIRAYADKGYLMDPHTAMCIKAYNELLRGRSNPVVMYSTAEWTKFSTTVARALNIYVDTDIGALEAVSEKTGRAIPESIGKLFEKPVIHSTVVEEEEIRREILSFI